MVLKSRFELMLQIQIAVIRIYIFCVMKLLQEVISFWVWVDTNTAQADKFEFLIDGQERP